MCRQDGTARVRSTNFGESPALRLQADKRARVVSCPPGSPTGELQLRDAHHRSLAELAVPT